MQDLRVENLLNERGVRWERRTIPVRSTRYDVETSRFQARVSGSRLRDDVVELYAQAMRAGNVFPDVVVNNRGDGTYDVLGGFHRLNAAARVGIHEMGAYVLAVDQARADVLARSLNTLESVVGATKAERVAQALRIISLHHYTQAKAAQLVGVSQEAVSVEVRANSVRERLAGRVNTERRSSSELAELEQIGNDNVLFAVASLMVRAHLSQRQIRDLIADLKRVRTEEGQIETVRAWERTPLVQEMIRRANAGRVTGPRTYRPVSKLTRFIHSAMGVLTRYDTPAKMGITKDELEQVIRIHQDYTTQMQKFLTAESIIPNGQIPEEVAAGHGR